MSARTIVNLVRNRLTYLVDADEPIIEDFKQEIFALTQMCLGKTTDEAEDEANYNLLERSFIADVVAYYMLAKKIVDTVNAGSTNSTGSTTTSAGTFLKKAKAGSAEVEWDLIKNSSSQSVSISQFGMPSGDLISFFKSEAAYKAGLLGCNLVILGMEVPQIDVLPFITSGSCGDCGCGGCMRSNIPPYRC